MTRPIIIGANRMDCVVTGHEQLSSGKIEDMTPVYVWTEEQFSRLTDEDLAGRVIVTTRAAENSDIKALLTRLERTKATAKVDGAEPKASRKIMVLAFDFKRMRELFVGFGMPPDEAQERVAEEYQRVVDYVTNLPADDCFIVDESMIKRVGNFDYRAEYVDALVVTKENDGHLGG
jgi:hypothetical protein